MGWATLKEITMRERWVIGMKVVCLVICLAFAFRGHPPVSAQDGLESAYTGRGATVEDAIQDHDISQVKADEKNDRELIAAQSVTLVAQGQQISSLNEDVRFGGGILSLIMTGSIVVSLKKKAV